ncbi:MAG: barstar family protein [Deltaproteobacteria bacterium]|nr:barstar family protein [Deltaproteobacteria bacterium]
MTDDAAPAELSALPGLLEPGAPAVRAARALDGATLPAGARVARLDAAILGDEAAVHAALAEALALPDHYGRNWDALADLLRDEDVVQPGAPVVIVLRDAGRACLDAPEALDALASVVQDADAHWRADAGAAQVVRLVLVGAAPPQLAPGDFAAEWVDAWNARDLERVLAHYTEDMEVRSSFAARLDPASGGVVRGKEAVRAYWGRALAASPDLRFELRAVFRAPGAVTIVYRNHRGEDVAETMLFGPDGRASRVLVGR